VGILAASKPRIYNPIMNCLKSFCTDERGQDLIEYALLMAFVALASAALFIGSGQSVQGIWSASNSELSAANRIARRRLE
jgi:Flp pilus assembly pilin Flp